MLNKYFWKKKGKERRREREREGMKDLILFSIIHRSGPEQRKEAGVFQISGLTMPSTVLVIQPSLTAVKEY